MLLFFQQTIAVVGSIVLGIIVLAIFFKLLSWFENKPKTTMLQYPFTEILNKQSLANFYLDHGKVVENVRLVGFTNSGEVTTAFSEHLRNFAITQHSDGTRTLIPAKKIWRIDVAVKEEVRG